jgi:predicted small secreted protein
MHFPKLMKKSVLLIGALALLTGTLLVGCGNEGVSDGKGADLDSIRSGGKPGGKFDTMAKSNGAMSID